MRKPLIEVDDAASGRAIVNYYYDGLNRRGKKDLASGDDVLYTYQI